MSGERVGASPSENGEQHVDAGLFETAMARPGNTPSRALEQVLHTQTMTQPCPPHWSQDQHVSPSDLAAVNRILAPLGLRLGTNHGAGSVTLGFTDDNGPEHVGSRFELLRYWGYLESWMQSVHQEGLYRHIEMAIEEEIRGIVRRCSRPMFG
ncbi:hypothetical protein NM208_g2064 [Fusarium decemcellulare]|uniref:Uncharacterized protein n=1 Tax=Fusarium decemcellulare TaxID=57161 RepID=A0ACC1SU79_9HYPO|nr:hypothetical protein NM208_g2064 [Fusarium decemcellulare]